MKNFILLFLFFNLGSYAQDCNLDNFCYFFDECISEDTYRLYMQGLDFEEDLYVAVNGDTSFFSDSGMVNVLPFALLPSNQRNDLTVGYANSEGCYIRLDLMPRSCDRNCEACDIRDIVMENHEPNDDCEYYIDFSFIAENTCSDLFFVKRNGVILCCLFYSEDYHTIGPFSDDLGGVEIEIIDQADTTCRSEKVFLAAPDCEPVAECEIRDLDVEVANILSDSSYTIIINAVYENVDSLGFDLWWDHEFYGFYRYSELPLTIEVVTRGLEYEHIRISDNDNEDCLAVLEFMSPVFTSSTDEKSSSRIYQYNSNGVYFKENMSEIKIYNIMGQLVLNRKNINNVIYNEHKFSSGIYIMYYTDMSGKRALKSIPIVVR